ncbi:terpene utilization protein AtuA [Mesorhizobium sp. L-8-10]|uniref:acyclic terpene utilization AtuA family protein n=1 Tax=Mesorhizobium sp. L-8-10 TaxID=2744523 RepID=UPI001926F442|nr:acyclic terpene utilization AtuA family protein [Mesorhizobium sp. L-8-10]BCH33342.1 terpene utilization protein AtuA [Mesorhizobium sp. L-8-10]
MKEIVRIGCGAGFWGDSPEGSRQLVRAGGIDYLVLDYLAEITMSILARMKAKRPDLGYATDFVTMVMQPLAREIADKRIRVVTNAGGVNPEACRDALAAVFKAAGVDLKIAVVRGDDLSGRIEDYRRVGVCEMFSGAALPERIASVNAYLGAFPIAAALDAGADIVLTGRCVDSAIVLGPLIHEFGWKVSDYDLLSAGSLAGHVVECGTQATGGIITDWRDAAAGWDNMGFPIAECRADGTFELTKPAGTGGLVSPMTVGEQIVYEVGDPAAYVLPDVTCDWTRVKLEQTGKDRVHVSGARGRSPTGSFKVSATYADGYRAAVTMMIAGRDAVEKAETVGKAILARSTSLMQEAGLPGFSETSVEVLGGEASYGRSSRARTSREVVLKIAVRHPSKEALQIFGREIYPAATAMAQGLTGFAGGRPEPQPVVRLFSFLAQKGGVPVEVEIDGKAIPVAASLGSPAASPERGEKPDRDADSAPSLPAPDETGDHRIATVPLVALAHGRSGDKGDIANIGVLARRPEFVPVLRQALTPDTVGAYLAHFAKGKVERYEWPGLDAFNFLLHEGLGGGGIASLRHDPQGKAMAQILMDMPVSVPAAWLVPGGPLAGWKEQGAMQGTGK